MTVRAEIRPEPPRDCEMEWTRMGEEFEEHCAHPAVGRFLEPNSGETMWLCKGHKESCGAFEEEP